MSEETYPNQASATGTDLQHRRPTAASLPSQPSPLPLRDTKASAALNEQEDPVLLKEQQVMGMLSPDGSTRQRVLTAVAESYHSDYDDDDEEDRSYRDAEEDRNCLMCVVM